MRQERSYVDVSLGVNSLLRLCIVDDGDQPVPVSSNVKNYVVIDGIRVFKHVANLGKIVPANGLDNADPQFNFFRCIGMVLHRFAEKLARDDVHNQEYFTTCEVVKGAYKLANFVLTSGAGEAKGSCAAFERSRQVTRQ